ncbi:mannitol dehydrogenase family protein [Nocardiopsis mangrovi]|uniref:Mannitol dehydrogenase family protein n=1 Tax=Nocardiopsis mangrovi TaxID=1179818 RepID=A0ABV9E6N0_9ACTN
MTRLSLAALRRAGRSPALDRGALRTGVVHLGIGAFFRAHGALLTEDAMLAEGSGDWGISAVTGRSPRVRDQLAPQDGLFTVTERGAGGRPTRLVSSVREVIAGPRDPAGVLARIADPATRIVTLTITEKGYRIAPRTGGLDLADPAVAADLAGAAPTTPIGQLARGLQARLRGDGGPLTVVSCDNLPENGALTARLVAEFAEALPGSEGAELRSWTAARTAFPSTMVDRMVPATTAADLDRVEQDLGLRDEGAVIAEPFFQWVIEDAFAAARPDWAAAGARFTADVRPWEAAKLRILNAAHSLVAYLGLIGGYATIAESVADERVAAAARGLVHSEVLPAITLPGGLDGPAYGDSVLERFANPALGHTTAKVAGDGSQKIGPRLLSTAGASLAAGREPRWSALAVAAWMRHVADAGTELDDPLAGPLRALLAEPGGGGRGTVPALLRSDVFPEELAAAPAFAALVGHWYGVLERAGLDGLTAEETA